MMLGSISNDCWTSLPLMGIRNPPGIVRTSHVRVKLSHYPSWGSGTSANAAVAQLGSNTSLPLMGIRNFLLACIPPIVHLLSTSLPLMGIRNWCAPSVTEAEMYYELTTPHGDQEPAISDFRPPR